MGPGEAAIDWVRFDAMTEDERHTAALADPDARPLSEDDMAALPHMPQAKVIRRALGLSQDAFALRFRIPLGTLRDWEQGLKVPDGAARACLMVIASCPVAVAAALAPHAAWTPHSSGPYLPPFHTWIS